MKPELDALFGVKPDVTDHKTFHVLQLMDYERDSDRLNSWTQHHYSEIISKK